MGLTVYDILEMENGSAKFTDVQWLVAGTMRPFAPFDEAPPSKSETVNH